MYRAVCVLGLLALYVRLAHSWDIAVSLKEQLVFYTNGTKTNTVNLFSQNPTALVYDELHNMILYVDKETDNDTICGYNLSSTENKCFIKRNGRNIRGLAFDPVSETIFFTDTNDRSINSISLKPGYNNNVYGNLLFKLENRIPTNIAVDSCTRYIYWTNKSTKNKYDNWERARFNGSEKEVFFAGKYFQSFCLAIDLQTQKIVKFVFCIECNYYNNITNKLVEKGDYLHSYISFTDLDGQNNRNILYSNAVEKIPKSLTVSKDYIYYTMISNGTESLWQLPKNAMTEVKPKEVIKFDRSKKTFSIIANYKIEDQIKGIQVCGSLSSLISTITVAPGHIDERPDTSVCENYCLQGHCSFNDNGLPKCSCDVGYSGPRCEINMCQGYCLNSGDCSLNEKDLPVCQCDGNHEGSRCEADINDTNTNCGAEKRNGTLTYLLSILQKPSSKMYLTVEL